MRPGPKPKNSVFTIGPVRVVERKSGYRILWYHDNKQRERTATTLARAKEIAREVEADLDRLRPTLPETRFSKLIAHATDPTRNQWSQNWAERQNQIAVHHIQPKIGNIECARLDKRDIIDLLNKLVADGYSYSTVEKTRQIVGRAVKVGISQGIWTPGQNPMVDVKTPFADEADDDGEPIESKLPTASQVEELITVMRADKQIYGDMAEVAAFTGVRWGELLALRAAVIDLDKRRLTVNLTCVEDNRGRFVYQSPSKTGRARTKPKPRLVPIEDRLIPIFERMLDTIPTLRAGGDVDGVQPKDLFFRSRTGNPYRRSSFHQVFARNSAKVQGWPEGASVGYLRHWAATRWITAPPGGYGIEVPTVALMLGHTNVATTFAHYVHTDAEALERAKAKMR